MLLGKFKIKGHSMTPAIKEGDKVLVSSLPFLFSNPKAGDVVVFNSLNKTMIKRVKRVKGNLFLMEGDNISDSLSIGWISKNDIIGIVIYKL